MNNTKKKMITIMICALMIVTTVFMPTTANAADTNIMHKSTTAFAGAPINYNFSINRDSDLRFIVRLETRNGLRFTIKDSLLGTSLVTDSISTGDSRWNYQKKTGIFELKHDMHLEKGDYILEIAFDQDTNFEMTMDQLSLEAKLNKSSISITKGFTDTLKVTGGKIKSCSSSNTKVATVSNNGKIIAKAIGTAKIKVKLTNGKTLTCKVNVKPNQYSGKNITVTDTLLNTYQMKAYKASFDKKGHLVVNFKIANTGSGRITTISNLKIAVTTSNKSKIATYKKASFAVDLNSYKDKTYSITIPKSSLKMKQKNIDLRTAKIKISDANTNSEL